MAEYIDRVEYCEKHCRCSNEKCERQRCPIWKAPAVAIPQWISVKDRLPEDNDRVIVFRPYEAEISAYRYCVKWGWSLKTSMSYDGITHWMPLPEPPKGENDG